MKVTSGNFDINGMSAMRLMKHYLGGKVTPLRSTNDGLEFKHVLGLLLRHHFGYAIAYVTTRYERQWQRLLSRWRRVQARKAETAAGSGS